MYICGKYVRCGNLMGAIKIKTDMKKTILLSVILAVLTVCNCLAQRKVKQAGEYGFEDNKGNLIIPCKYEDAFNFSEGLAAAKLNGKWGFIDASDKVVIPFIYERTWSFSEGLVAVKRNGKWGYIDKSGNTVISHVYEYASDFVGGLACIEKGDKCGFIDKTGKIVISPIYDDAADEFSEGLAYVEKDEKCGFIDRTGKVVIKIEYDDVAEEFSEGLAYVEKNEKYGFVDKTGKVVIKIIYDDVEDFKNGLACVEKNGKSGFINRNGDVVIPIVYDDAMSFSCGLARVKQNGKWGYIDKTGKFIIPRIYDEATSFSPNGVAEVLEGIRTWFIDTDGNRYGTESSAIEASTTFSIYARKYVEKRVNEWQKKGEYEKTADWKARVNENTRNKKIKELTAEAEKRFLEINASNIQLTYELGAYDADNEVYLVNCSGQDILVPVPIADAKTFRNEWDNIKKEPKFCVENDYIAVREATFTMASGKSYQYSNDALLNYTIADVDYNFEPIDIDDYSSSAGKGKQNINRVTIVAGSADVDIDIPINDDKNENTFAVIIGNENYKSVAKVPFAANDAEVFAKYCVRTLGISENNIVKYKDASYGMMLSAINYMKDVSANFDGDINIIFYYAGHGIPNEADKSAYLLPVDADGRQTEVCYGIDRLFYELGSMSANSVVVFLDACFSGAQRGGGMLSDKRGVALKPRESEPVGNMVVFTATAENQTADSYEEMGHGMFTYFLLDKLRDTRGNVTLKELGDYIITNVKRQSIVTNKATQTPTVTPSSSMHGWEKMKLR